MPNNEKVNIIIAETAPVLLAGYSHCLRKVKSLHANIIEVSSSRQLEANLIGNKINLLLINPTFGGYFNPEHAREISAFENLKIVALEIGKLSSQVVSLYDEIFSITDDLESLENKLSKLFSLSKEDNNDKEALSQREKEIVSLVVKGLTNQEIADKLFLSIHTVITHRRNIARKLEIHSATGLTIYAIVNKIVDLNEIKL